MRDALAARRGMCKAHDDEQRVRGSGCEYLLQIQDPSSGSLADRHILIRRSMLKLSATAKKRRNIKFIRLGDMLLHRL